jgi:hypothetical protein
MPNYCVVHNEYHQPYGGQIRCKSCKQESNRLHNKGKELFWRNRISKLDMEAGMHMHHRIESALARAYFKIFGRMDRERSNQTSLSTVIQHLPFTLKNELRLRAELLFCKPMKDGAHRIFHSKLSKGEGYVRW